MLPLFLRIYLIEPTTSFAAVGRRSCYQKGQAVRNTKHEKAITTSLNRVQETRSSATDFHESTCRKITTLTCVYSLFRMLSLMHFQDHFHVITRTLKKIFVLDFASLIYQYRFECVLKWEVLTLDNNSLLNCSLFFIVRNTKQVAYTEKTSYTLI